MPAPSGAQARPSSCSQRARISRTNAPPARGSGVFLGPSLAGIAVTAGATVVSPSTSPSAARPRPRMKRVQAACVNETPVSAV
eukprot:6192765-Pleurochrysis_carterae.AAC.1